MSDLSIGERWATHQQPADMREALTEVIVFLKLGSDFYGRLPSQAETTNPFQITKENEEQIIKANACGTVTRYLARKPTPWKIGQWKQPLPNFVFLPLHWRAQNKCEDCGARTFLVTHHLHYQTLGCETPTDLVLLCRDCHRNRHIYAGVFLANPTTIPF